MHEIPTKINKYNVYNEGERILGMGDELPLPGFESSGETVSGADPTVGYFSNQEMEIPFRVLDRDAVDMLDQRKAVRLTIRGSAQSTNSEGDIVFHSVRVVVRGRMSKFELGKLKAGSGMEVKITLTLLYILIELDGEPMVELDKLNEVFKIRGKDMLAEIKEMC